MAISGAEFSNREDRLPKFFFKAASQAIQLHCKFFEYNYYRLRLPFGKFDSYPKRVEELAFRVFILAVDCGFGFVAYRVPVVAASVAVGFSVVFLIMRAVGSILQQKGRGLGGFSHTRGAFPEKDFSADHTVKQMTFNVAALAGGFSYGFAGVRPWKQRIDAMVGMIREEQPDVLVLQEVMDTDFSNALIKALRTDFAHFFSHLGVSATFPFSGGFAPGGMFFATKGAVYHFSDHPYTAKGRDQCRSFGCLELLDRKGGIPFARFIGAHPAWKEEEASRRALQWGQIQGYVKARETLPTFLLADTNVERDEEEGKNLASWLEFYYQGKNPTCWHSLPNQWKEDLRFAGADPRRPRQIDNIGWFRGAKIQPKLLDCHLVKAYRDDSSEAAFDTRTAISDHHAVVAIVQIKPVATFYFEFCHKKCRKRVAKQSFL